MLYEYMKCGNTTNDKEKLKKFSLLSLYYCIYYKQ